MSLSLTLSLTLKLKVASASRGFTGDAADGDVCQRALHPCATTLGNNLVPVSPPMQTPHVQFTPLFQSTLFPLFLGAGPATARASPPALFRNPSRTNRPTLRPSLSLNLHTTCVPVVSKVLSATPRNQSAT